jgi:predicted O-methyltransferase YrrM
VTKQDIIESMRSLPPSWHANGSLNLAVIEELFRRASGALETAETGCGRSTLVLSHASKRHLVFACDVPSGEDPETHSLYQVRKSQLLKAEACEFVIGATQRTLPVFDFDREFDLVFLDGPHGYPFTELEYFYFYPHIKPGGWLVIDDIQIPTVANMVDVLKKDAMFSLDTIVRTTAFFRRTEARTFPPYADGWWEQGYNKSRGVAIRHVGLSAKPRAIAHELWRRIARR